MWDFLQYTFGEQAFKNLSLRFSEVVEARVEVGAEVWAFRTILRIYYKSFLEYLETLVAAAGGFSSGSPASYLENFDSRGGKESGGAIDRRSR